MMDEKPIVFSKKSKKGAKKQASASNDGTHEKKKSGRKPCTSCDVIGHTSSQCRNVCFICKGSATGHLPEECPERCRCSEDSIWHLRSACNIVCYLCSSQGHRRNDCPDRCMSLDCYKHAHLSTNCPSSRRTRRGRYYDDDSLADFYIARIPSTYSSVEEVDEAVSIAKKFIRAQLSNKTRPKPAEKTVFEEEDKRDVRPTVVPGGILAKKSIRKRRKKQRNKKAAAAAAAADGVVEETAE